MKKVILAVIAMVVVSATACKKDDAAQPEANSTVKVLDKKDTSQWD